MRADRWKRPLQDGAMITDDIVRAPDPAAFNMAAEQSGNPWRLSKLGHHGWVLVDASGSGNLLDLRDARSDFEAVRRAVAYLLSERRL
jgi:hypothetical protein